MVFRRDRNADIFDVGILEAKNLAAFGLGTIPDHNFQITITPDPITRSGELLIRASQLAQYVPQGSIWKLDVVDADGNIRKGIRPTVTTPNLNRHDIDPKQHDFAWLINMEELHGPLSIRPGRLKPIVRMTHGLLSTIEKAGPIDLVRGAASSPTTIHFGYVAETVGLDIGLLPGEALVLRVGNTVIFRVNYDPAISYQIAIENVPDMAMPMPDAPDHFQVYYGLLFPGIGLNDRYKLQFSNPPETYPTHTQTSMTGGPNASVDALMPDPDPFKCGGITVGDGDGPLG